MIFPPTVLEASMFWFRPCGAEASPLASGFCELESLPAGCCGDSGWRLDPKLLEELLELPPEKEDCEKELEFEPNEVPKIEPCGEAPGAPPGAAGAATAAFP